MASNRPRGFANWKPRTATRALLEQVQTVLDTYADQLPVTGRQVFYRLVATVDYPKSEQAYKRLLETLNRARRAGLIPMQSIRDDGVTAVGTNRFESGDDYLDAVRRQARHFRFDLQLEQTFYVELLCEAAGMVPQLNRIADVYGIPVRSSGGFDSTTVKHRLGEFYGSKGKPVIVLHVGDHDPSGEHIHQNLQEDVGAFAGSYGTAVRVDRVAVTPAQQSEFNLPTAPPKENDKRSFESDFTVQAEALPPDVMQNIVTAAIEQTIDLDIWREAVERQAEIRDQLVKALDGISVL